MRFVYANVKSFICLSVMVLFSAMASYCYADSASVTIICAGGGSVDVVIRNISDDQPAVGGLITWSNVAAGQTGWKTANQYIEISHADLPEFWGIQMYTDNENVSANPKYTGTSNPAGLVKTDNTIFAIPMAWRISDSVISNPRNPVPRLNNLGFNDYLWHFLKDKNTPDNSTTAYDESFQDGEDYITLWNQAGIAWNEGGRSGNPGKAYIYLAANFTMSSIDSVYSTSALTIEAYEGLSPFPVYLYNDGAPDVQMAYEYMNSQMDKYFQDVENRLIESYSEPYPPGPAGSLESVAFTYDNALVISAYLARPTEDNLRRAKLLCQSLMWAQEYDAEDDGRIRDAYYATDQLSGTTAPSSPVGFNSVNTGNIAFFINALMHYYKNANDTDTEFLNDLIYAAGKAGDFIHNNFYHSHPTKAGYYCGYKADGSLDTSKSTENNMIAYVAFSHLYDVTGDNKWLTRATLAKDFVDNIAWQPGQKRYICGLNANSSINNTTLVADTNLLAVLAMGNLAKNNDAINYTINTFSYSDAQKGLDGIDFGYNIYDAATEPDGIWFEGTAQLAAAYKVAGFYGYTDDSDKYLESIKLAQYNAQNADNKGIVVASKDSLTTGLGWYYYASPHIASTAWFAATSLNYNMLWGTALDEAVPLPADNRSFTADPGSLIDKNEYLQNHYTPSGWMNYVLGATIVDSRYNENPYLGDSCFKISWNGQSGSDGWKWAGIIWQEPEDEWFGGIGKGYDLRGAEYLTFWARTDDFTYEGAPAGKDMKIEVYFGYPGDSSGKTPNSTVTLTTQWQQYSIFVIGRNMSHVSNGFSVIFKDINTPRADNKCNIYIDDIRFDTY